MKASKEYPLYVFVMGDQKAYLHQGNAKTPDEAMEQLRHITEDNESSPVAVLEVTDCNMFKLTKVKEDFCPACGVTASQKIKCHCTR